ncbi:mammalian cell entry protein, partial [Mycobacterium tuberculosis]|nr:mammalian cell entry protein [Mycobacterium tuberculosis]
DLDMLLGGFKPLLRGLDPGQVNDLTEALLQVFQGQGGTLVSLLDSGGSFAKTLGERDALIGSVIDNLNTVLATIDERGKQFDT